MNLSELLQEESNRNQAIAILKEAGIIIRTPEEDTAFQTRIKQATLDTEMPAKTRELYDKLDADIKATFGVDKAPNEKTYDYLKRVGAATVGELTESKTKIEQLSDAAQGTEKLQAKLREKETEFANRYKTLEEKLQQVENEKGLALKSNLFQQATGDFYAKLPKDKLPAFFDEYDQTFRESLINNSLVIEEDGKKLLVLKDEAGNPKRGADYSYVTPATMVQQKYGNLIQVEQPANQGGSGSQAKYGEGGVVLSRKPQSKADVMELLGQAGKVKGTKEYDQAYAQVISAHPDLPYTHEK